MNTYRADLHIHTVLSPCGDLEMSPSKIVKKACDRGLNIIGITDHNSTKHCGLVRHLAEAEDIFVLMGAEVTTREEVHCLVFFENESQLSEFQFYIDKHLLRIENNTDKFGYQVVVDAEETITEEIKHLLLSVLDQSIEQIEKKVHELDGIFIPAHIDRPSYSIYSQLGFIPTDLLIDGVEISAECALKSITQRFGDAATGTIIRNSDAHYIENIGKAFSTFEMNSRSFNEVKLSLQGAGGRKVTIE